jgi:hypothetical protein
VNGQGRSPNSQAWLAWLQAHPGLLTALTAGAVLVIMGVVLVRDRLLAWRHHRFASGARWVTISPPPQVEPPSASSAWMTLAGVLTPARWTRLVYGTAHLAWEYTWAARTLTIRIWVPGTIPPGAVEAAVAAAWPGATAITEPADDPIPAIATVQAGGALWPQLPQVLPLRTDHDADPLRALLAAGATLRRREHACLQVLARPAPARRVAAARRASTTSTTGPVRLGGGRGDLPGRVVGGLAWALVQPVVWLTEVFLPGQPGRGRPSSPAAARSEAHRDPVAEVHRRAAGEKVARVPHYEVAIRYAVAAIPASPPTDSSHSDPDATRDRQRQQRDRLTGLAHTLASAATTYTRPNWLRRMRMRQPVQVLAGRRLRRGFLATVEELGVLAALPQDLAVPGLDRARAKPMPAPAAIPAGGRTVKVLGRAQLGGHAVGLAAADARQHVHLVGKTGTGKSTLMLHMILADVHARRGVVVVDPRGDLILDLLDRLPADAADRLVLIDPDQPHPGRFNPLATTGLDAATDAHLAVDNLVGIFSKIFGRHWGPRIDDTLRVSCLTLMRQPNPTLSMVPKLLTDRADRIERTRTLTDSEELKGFWTWYDSMNDGLRAQVIGPVLARLRAFLLRDFVREVIGSAQSSFRMSDVLDGGILLARLPKGILGEDTARILGSLIVARTWQAAIARAAVPEDRRRDAALYIDECHNFLTLPGSVEDMLAEARGFRLGLVLAHQDLAQLPRETQAAVSANARSKLYFTVEPDDARQLAKHTLPELDEHDLAHLDNHIAAARLLVDGRELPAFTLTTTPPPEALGHSRALRLACAEHLAARSSVEETPTPSGPAEGKRGRRRPQADRPADRLGPPMRA